MVVQRDEGELEVEISGKYYPGRNATWTSPAEDPEFDIDYVSYNDSPFELTDEELDEAVALGCEYAEEKAEYEED